MAEEPVVEEKLIGASHTRCVEVNALDFTDDVVAEIFGWLAGSEEGLKNMTVLDEVRMRVLLEVLQSDLPSDSEAHGHVPGAVFVQKPSDPEAYNYVFAAVVKASVNGKIEAVIQKARSALPPGVPSVFENLDGLIASTRALAAYHRDAVSTETEQSPDELSCVTYSDG